MKLKTRNAALIVLVSAALLTGCGDEATETSESTISESAQAEPLTAPTTPVAEPLSPVAPVSTPDPLAVITVTSAQVLKIQQALIDAGFNPGPADGIIGRNTRAALKDYQQQHNLAMRGITRESLQALGVAE